MSKIYWDFFLFFFLHMALPSPPPAVFLLIQKGTIHGPKNNNTFRLTTERAGAVDSH